METNLEELQLTPSEVEAITPKVIADVIQEIRREKAVWVQFFKTNRDLVRTGGDAVVFPKKKAGITVSLNMSAGQSLSASNITYDSVTISVKKHGIGIGIQGEAIRKAARDVIADQIKEAGLMWADAEDQLALEAMFPVATITRTGAGTTAVSYNIVGIKSKTSGFSHAINTSSGAANVVFSGAGTVIVYKVPSEIGASVGASGSINAKNILECRSKLIGKIVNPSVLCIHPDRLVDIIYDPAVKFTEQATQTGQGFPYKSQIGKLWDMNVIVSGRVPRYSAILLDPDLLGYRIVRKELTLEKDAVTGLKSDCLYYWGFAEESFGVVESDAYGVVYMLNTTIDTANVWRVSP